MSKRLKFFIKHLTLSLVFSIILLGLLLNFWYQMPLAKAVGVTSIILILFFIDITLGPLLGLLVYKEHKKSLKFDLSIIIIIQIFAYFMVFIHSNKVDQSGLPIMLIVLN